MNNIFSVMWTEVAKNDLFGILDYLSHENATIAKDILDQIINITKNLNTFPLRGRIVPELRQNGIILYMELVLPPWRIIYKVEAKTVWVLAIIDGRRNVADLLLERLIKNNY